jgi:hypothetical protein
VIIYDWTCCNKIITRHVIQSWTYKSSCKILCIYAIFFLQYHYNSTQCRSRNMSILKVNKWWLHLLGDYSMLQLKFLCKSFLLCYNVLARSNYIFIGDLPAPSISPPVTDDLFLTFRHQRWETYLPIIQGSSTHLTLCTGYLFVVKGCLMHCRTFNSLYSHDANITQGSSPFPIP